MVAGVATALSTNLVGIYLRVSPATGAFNPATSDIDRAWPSADPTRQRSSSPFRPPTSRLQSGLNSQRASIIGPAEKPFLSGSNPGQAFEIKTMCRALYTLTYPDSLPPMAISAGILLYRFADGRLEVLIAHPGGPLWAKRNIGAWSIPKGLADDGEDLAAAAVREFAEETGYLPQGPFRSLGEVTLKSGKTVAAWAAEGDFDPKSFASNTFEMEWPPKSGLIATFPEIDQVEWVEPAAAVRLLNPAQSELIDRLVQLLG